uniref:Protein kinase domain-containing protein n=1 Tax=Alexandrium monilatum TaxID=311494 RepID=A0A6T1J6C5_9DINO
MAQAILAWRSRRQSTAARRSPEAMGGRPSCGCESSAEELPMVGRFFPNCCEDMEDARVVNFEEAVFDAQSSRPSDNEIRPISCGNKDFVAMGVVPLGWEITADEVPEGFSFLGGTACVIQKTDMDPSSRKHILLAMPEWAVDVDLAYRLAQLTTCLELDSRVCRLWRVSCVHTFNTVVFEFEAPQGEPLSRWLQRCGHIPEDGAVELCRGLLHVVSHLQGVRLCLWGLIHTSMTYVDHGASFATVLPVACLFSFHGAKCAAVTMCDRCADLCLTPEMERAITVSDRALLQEPEARSAADNYAVAALVLRAIAKVGPEDACWAFVSESVSEAAADLLSKALCRDYAWRLTPQNALVHRWLRPCAQVG